MVDSTDPAVEEKEEVLSDAAVVDTDGFGASAVADEVILEVSDLETHFTTRGGTVKAVDGISYHERYGQYIPFHYSGHIRQHHWRICRGSGEFPDFWRHAQCIRGLRLLDGPCTPIGRTI